MSTLSYSAIISERSLNGREPSAKPGVRTKFLVKGMSFWYGTKQALWDISLNIPERSVVALIGPSGCGKSTFLRSLNRMNDLIEGTRHVGDLLLDGVDIYGRARQPGGPAPPRRHGVPEVEPVPQVGLRERGLRAARGRHEQPSAA